MSTLTFPQARRVEGGCKANPQEVWRNQVKYFTGFLADTYVRCQSNQDRYGKQRSTQVAHLEIEIAPYHIQHECCHEQGDCYGVTGLQCDCERHEQQEVQRCPHDWKHPLGWCVRWFDALVPTAFHRRVCEHRAERHCCGNSNKRKDVLNHIILQHFCVRNNAISYWHSKCLHIHIRNSRVSSSQSLKKTSSIRRNCIFVSGESGLSYMIMILYSSCTSSSLQL